MEEILIQLTGAVSVKQRTAKYMLTFPHTHFAKEQPQSIIK